jgi:hypothetical protein
MERFLGINSSLLILKFLSGFLPSFPFYRMLIMKRLEFSCVVDFIVRVIKPRVEYGVP